MFKNGDQVRVKGEGEFELDWDLWVDGMEQCYGRLGTVECIDHQTVDVLMGDGKCWTFKQDWLEPYVEPVKTFTGLEAMKMCLEDQSLVFEDHEGDTARIEDNIPIPPYAFAEEYAPFTLKN